MNNENSLKKSVLKNVLYVLGAQLVILIISVIRSFLLPAFLNVESYGYWQVYLFYSTYVGILAFGFNDGLYLRYGDKSYNELPFYRLRSAIRIFVVILSLFTVLSVCMILLLFKNSTVKFPLLFTAFNVLILGLTGVYSYVLQITNQLKRFSLFTIADKILVIFSVLVLIVIKDNNYKIIIVIDFIAKTAILLVLMVIYKDLLWGKNCGLIEAFTEFKTNISIGYKLLIAGLMGMVVIGIGRFLIQVFGNIKDFATYSFGITITGLVLTAVTAFSLVLYPTIKRLDENNYANYFNNINLFIITFNFIALLSYFPSYLGIESYYNKYSDMLEFLNLLFAIALMQSKMSILNNTFYKALRKEKAMMNANISSVIIFSIIGPVLYFFTKSIWFIAFASFVTMFIRCYASEIYLKKILNIRIDLTLFLEIVFLLIFILITSISNLWIAGMLYIFFLTIWLYYKKLELYNLFKKIKINS